MKVKTVEVYYEDKKVAEFNNVDGYKVEDNNFFIVFHSGNLHEVFKMTEKMWTHITLENDKPTK